ncbi:MAG: elongation factor G [Clostridiales bacterium]|nr:elongation factor G [Clostridiales bacterium]
MGITAKEIKNIAIIGHSGEGKTTLCEAMLFNAGVIDRMGTVESGATVTDFDEIERAKKFSVYTSVAHLNWKGIKINLLDLPGFYDFEGERHEGLAACGGAVLVIGANGVLPIGAESVVNYCLKLGKPLVIFINGMDKPNADYAGTVAALKEKYAGKIAPIQLPIMRDGKMTGYINSIQERAYEFSTTGPKEIPVPDDLKEQMDAMQDRLVETAAENDELLLDKYFEQGGLTKADAVHGIRKGIATGNVIPIMAGSALNNRGVINLLDEIVTYMPTANERRRLATDLAADELIYVDADETQPFAALVYKTVYDSYTGKLNYIKVLRGKLKTGDTVYNATTGKEERIGQIFTLAGKKCELVTELTAGDLGAVNKLAATDTNHTLCAVGTNIQFDPVRFPRPCLSLAVKAANKGEEDKVFAGLAKMREEDYTFSVTKNNETGELILSGQGETHIEILCAKLKSRFGISTILSEPKIPYRETIRKAANAEGKHKKQSGGHGQYGHCKVRFEPCDSDFEFGDEVVGGTVPKQYIPAVEKGLRECLARGVLAGYPVVGVRAVLYDGSYHDVDSSEMAFKAAAALAFREGIKNASPVLLEPVVKLKTAVAGEYLGAVMGDISKRRGRIVESNTDGDITTVVAEVPLSETAKYATELRSLTRGQGRFSTEFLRYEEMPPALAEKVIAAANEN